MGKHVDLRVNLLVKIVRKYITKSINLTCSNSRISSIKGNIKRTSSCSHYRIFCIYKKRTVFPLAQSHFIANLISIGRRKGSVQKELPFFFWKASFLDIKPVHGLIYRLNMKHLLRLTFPTHYICGPGSLGCFYAIYILKCFHIIFRKPHSSYNLNVHQTALVIIGITGIAHIRRGGLNT